MTEEQEKRMYANAAIYDAKDAVVKAAELNQVSVDEILEYIKTLNNILKQRNEKETATNNSN